MYKAWTVYTVCKTVSTPYIWIAHKLHSVWYYRASWNSCWSTRVLSTACCIVTGNTSALTGSTTIIAWTAWWAVRSGSGCGCSCCRCFLLLNDFALCRNDILIIICLLLCLSYLACILLLLVFKSYYSRLDICLLLLIVILHGCELIHVVVKLSTNLLHLLNCCLIRIHKSTIRIIYIWHVLYTIEHICDTIWLNNCCPDIVLSAIFIHELYTLLHGVILLLLLFLSSCKILLILLYLCLFACDICLKLLLCCKNLIKLCGFILYIISSSLLLIL